MGEAYYNRGWVELRIGRRSEGLADLSKVPGRGKYIRLYAAVRAFHGEIGEVLGYAEAAGQDQCVVLLGFQLAHVHHIATGDARRFGEHVAAFRHFFAGEVIDDMHLRDVGGEALDLGAALIQAQQGDHAFVDFRAVIDATAGKDDRDSFVHAVLQGVTQEAMGQFRRLPG